MYPEGFFVWHLQRVKLFLSDTQMVNERRPNTSFWFRLTREPPFGIGSVKRRQPSTDPWLRRWLISRSYLRVIFPWFKDVLLAERKPSVRRSWLCLDLDMSELNCRALQFVQLGAALFLFFSSPQYVNVISRLHSRLHFHVQVEWGIRGGEHTHVSIRAHTLCQKHHPGGRRGSVQICI